MAQQYVRLALGSAIYPFYTDAGGRTIDVPQLDQNFDRFNAANTTPDKGVPQVFYLHNVLPIAGGFQSIAYTPTIEGLSGVTNFDSCYSIQDFDMFEGQEGPRALFSPSNGRNYVFKPEVGVWEQNNPLDPLQDDGLLVSVADVRKETFIFYEKRALYSYVAGNITERPIAGLDPVFCLGICEANGYLILFSRTEVFWSSITDPTNFDPLSRTGAGGGLLQQAKGEIRYAVHMPDGFIVFCERNAVGATYTGNVDYPFIFKEVSGSGGSSNPYDVAFQSSLPFFPGKTSSGVQQIDINRAIATMPEVSDFLTSGLFEDFDEVTDTFSVDNVGGQVAVRFSAIANRFIVISYGLNFPDFTHAIVYDMELNRYGKLKIRHRHAFEYVPAQTIGALTYSQLDTTTIQSLQGTPTRYVDFFDTIKTVAVAKNNVAFLQEDGKILLLDFNILNPLSNGVFIIGKYQHVRNNTIYHQISEVETLRFPDRVTLSILPTRDGSNFLPAVPATRTHAGPKGSRWAARVSGLNYSLLLKGSYNLTTIVTRYTLGGWR